MIFKFSRRVGGVVERGGLENRCGCKPTGGSNPSPSARRLSIAAALLSLAGSVFAVQVGDVISFAGDGGLRQVTLARATGERSFSGTLDGYDGAFNAVLTETDRGWRMSVDDWRQKKTWIVAHADGETDVRTYAKPRRTAGSCGRYVPPREAASESPRPLFKSVSAGGLTDGWEVDPVADEIDILVVFDKSAMLRLARIECSAETFAAEQIAKMNGVLTNSGLSGDFRVTLAGVFKADFDITRDCGRNANDFLYKALEYTCERTTSEWKAIRDERDRVGADTVVLLVEPDWTVPTEEEPDGLVGISCGLENDSERGLFGPTHELLTELREYAYSVCNIRTVMADDTFSHEVGHVMGAGHSELLSPDYSDPGPQLFPYSAALMYRDPVDDEYYYTVMGYDSTDGEFASPEYVGIPYFSSPALRHHDTGSSLGDALHDNVRSLREMYAVISQYRVNAKRRGAPIEPSAVWNKSRTVSAAVVEGGSVVGAVQLKIGKMNARTRKVRVSGSFTGLDGRKTTLKQQEKTVTVENDRVAVTLAGRNLPEPFTLVIDAEAVNGIRGAAILDVTKPVGGELPGASATFALDPDFVLGAAGETVSDLLPFAETFRNGGRRWSFDKAARVKLVKNRTTGASELVVDTDGGKTNRSALKLSYTAKTGVFKGSFKVYTLAVSASGRPRLVKYTVTVTGLVVDGHGTGLAVCKKTGATASVVLQTP